MSQDHPLPDPIESEPQPSESELEPQDTSAVSEARLESESQPAPVQNQPAQTTLQQVWSKAQPVLKTQTIKALRSTIQTLERVADRLEAEPPPSPPLASERSIPVQPSLERDTSESSPLSLVSSLPVADLRQNLLVIWQRITVWWSLLLEQIRARLPESINQSLSNRALTGILAGTLVLVLWITSSLLSSKPVSVAVVSPPQPEPSTLPTVAPVAPSPTVSPTVSVAPTAPIVPQVSPSPEVSPSPVIQPPAPAPKLQLSPEQKLIAAIQDQVAEISNQYMPGLIESVQANFRSSRLTVRVSEEWYGLERSQQDNFADEVLHRAQQLDFIKLEIIDSEAALLARSPVVGTEMVILQRSKMSSMLESS